MYKTQRLGRSGVVEQHEYRRKADGSRAGRFVDSWIDVAVREPQEPFILELDLDATNPDWPRLSYWDAFCTFTS